MNDEERNEQSHRTPERTRWWVGGWLAPLLVVAGTLVWVLLIYWLIGNRPTTWKFGTFPYVPGQSDFSVEPTPRGHLPPQVELPPRRTGGPNAPR